MGDGDHGARVLLQEAFQPEHRLGVEVVGGLVEQQQIWSGEQQAAERHPSLLATRQSGDIGIVGRATQRIHRDLDVAFKAPRVGGRDLVFEAGLLFADLVVVSVGVGPHGHDFVVAVDQRLHLGHAVHDVALHVFGRVELWLLGEVSHAEPGCEARIAREPIVEPSHDLQQARLAGAVRADDADFRSGIERQTRCSPAPCDRADRNAQVCNRCR